MLYEPTNPDDLSELLSAYLDDEVSSEERALVEQRLAESAEFRQLRDELAALRTGLENLPRYSLKEDLAPIVLRRAERAMIGAPSGLPASTAGGREQISLAEGLRRTERSPYGLQFFRWSVVAVAAALMVIIFAPRNRLGREVAQSTDDRAAGEVDRPAMVQEMRDESTDHYKQSAPHSGNMPSEAIQADEFADAPSRVQAPETAAPLSAAPLSAAAEATDEMQAAPAFADEAAEATAPAESLNGQAEGPLSKAQSNKAKPSGRLTKKLSEAATAKSGRASKLGIGGSTGDVLVVHCEISAEAAQSGAFEQLLAAQQIKLQKGPGIRFGVQPDSDGKQESAAALELEPLNEELKRAGDRNAGKDKSGETEAIGKSAVPSAPSALRFSGKLVDEGAQINAFLVDASPGQVQATLTELNARTEEFRAVDITPMPAKEALLLSGDRADKKVRPGEDVTPSESDDAIDAAEALGTKTPAAGEGRAQRVLLDADDLQRLPVPPAVHSWKQNANTVGKTESGMGGGGFSKESGPQDGDRRNAEAPRSKLRSRTKALKAPQTRSFSQTVPSPVTAPAAEDSPDDASERPGDRQRGPRQPVTGSAPVRVLFMLRVVPPDALER